MLSERKDRLVYLTYSIVQCMYVLYVHKFIYRVFFALDTGNLKKNVKTIKILFVHNRYITFDA